jgi:hypothetical protein
LVTGFCGSKIWNAVVASAAALVVGIVVAGGRYFVTATLVVSWMVVLIVVGVSEEVVGCAVDFFPVWIVVVKYSVTMSIACSAVATVSAEVVASSVQDVVVGVGGGKVVYCVTTIVTITAGTWVVSGGKANAVVASSAARRTGPARTPETVRRARKTCITDAILKAAEEAIRSAG